jgi:hypothetical protein
LLVDNTGRFGVDHLGVAPFRHHIVSMKAGRSMRLIRGLLLALLAAGVAGCAVVAVADAAVTVVATGVKVTAKAVGAVADAVIPDGDDKP